jgi:hypothetical protein
MPEPISVPSTELLVLIYAVNALSAVALPVSVSALAVMHPITTTRTNAAENLFKNLISIHFLPW